MVGRQLVQRDDDIASITVRVIRAFRVVRGFQRVICRRGIEAMACRTFIETLSQSCLSYVTKVIGFWNYPLMRAVRSELLRL